VTPLQLAAKSTLICLERGTFASLGGTTVLRWAFMLVMGASPFFPLPAALLALAFCKPNL